MRDAIGWVLSYFFYNENSGRDRTLPVFTMATDRRRLTLRDGEGLHVACPHRFRDRNGCCARRMLELTIFHARLVVATAIAAIAAAVADLEV